MSDKATVEKQNLCAKRMASDKALCASIADGGFSLNDLRGEIQEQIEKLTVLNTVSEGDMITPGPWVTDILAPAHEEGEIWEAVVSGGNGKLYCVQFKIAGEDVEVVGEPKEVEVISDYAYVNEPDDIVAMQSRNTLLVKRMEAFEAKARKDDGKFSSDPTDHSLEAFASKKVADKSGKKDDHAKASELFQKAADKFKKNGQNRMAGVHQEFADEHKAAMEACDTVKAKDAKEAAALEANHALDCVGAGDMRSRATLDNVMMYMPGGTHVITPSQNGKPVTVTVNVDAKSAEVLESQRRKLEAAGKKPFFSIQHDTEIAAFWPTEFFWDKRIDATGSLVEGVWARGEWTKSGREAVEGKDFRTFSPTFFVDAIRNSADKPAKVICEDGARPNMGALENDPAFQSISALWSKNAAGVPANNNKGNMETQTETLAELQARNQKLEKDILALQAKDDAVSKADLRAAQAELKEIKAQIALSQANEKMGALESAESKRKEEGAEAAVNAMVASGAIPVRDNELQATYKAKFIADPSLIPLMASKGMIGGAQVQPGRVTPGAGSDHVERYAIRGGADVKGALKQVAALTASSGRDSNMQLKWKAANEIGEIYARELRPILEKGGTFELQALTAAESLGTLAGTLVALRTLDFYKFEFPMLSEITTDFSDQPALFNQTTMTRIIVTPAVLSYSATLDTSGRPTGYTIVTPAATTDVPITLDKHRAVDIVFDANVLASTQRKLFTEQGPAAAYALGKDIVDALYAVITLANFGANAPFAVSAINYGRGTFAKASRILNLQGVPFVNRFALESSIFQEQLLQDPTLVNLAVYQSKEIITNNQLPLIAGFRPIEAPNLPATVISAGNNLAAFFAHKSALLIETRIPNDWNTVLGSGMSYGSVNVVTNPDTGLSVLMVQFSNPQSAHAEFRLALMYGVAPGNPKGGQIVTG